MAAVSTMVEAADFLAVSVLTVRVTQGWRARIERSRLSSPFKGAGAK
jgi:hypothetical protein